MSRTRKTVIAILAAAGLALGLGAATASGGTGHYAAGSQMYRHPARARPPSEWPGPGRMSCARR